jgi:hypothetical protein
MKKNIYLCSPNRREVIDYPEKETKRHQINNHFPSQGSNSPLWKESMLSKKAERS